MKKAGLILAGGKGERIGGKKPLKTLAGKPLIYWAFYPYYKLNLPLFISVRSEEEKREISNALAALGFSPFSLFFVLDHPKYRGLGPLSGLYSAMKSTKTQTLFVVSAVDQPFISKEIIAYLLSLGDIFFNFSIVFKNKNTFEPFPGIYPSALLPEIQIFLDTPKKKSIKSFLNYCLKKNLLLISDFWSKIDNNGLLFKNVNTLEDLREAEKCILTLHKKNFQG